MSDFIKHECGLAMIRLLKPLAYYKEKYGTPFYGVNKLRLLLQKMRNRGQDGAGMATIKLNSTPGQKYISRKRSADKNYLDDLFKQVMRPFQGLSQEQLSDVDWLYEHKPYMGELLMGHLRYGTHGDNSIATCHPFLRQNNWISRNLIVAGNFNLTNVDQLFGELVELGQYPKEKSDTVTVLEKIGHFLDDEVQRLHTWYKPDGLNNQEINEHIFNELDVQRLLRRASKKFDGGYVMGGMIGHGDAFVMRDPSGIRPAFYYHDDEVAVIASERPAIQTAFDVHVSKVKELQRGHALIIKRNGYVSEQPFIEQLPRSACSFERIYFSRGTDRDIYLERQALGRAIVDRVMEAVNHDFKNTVFSFVPNTAEASFFGMIKEGESKLNEWRKRQILKMGDKIDIKRLDKILNRRLRIEKIVVKDAKLRTFIADDSSRGEMISHVYDVTYGIVRNEKDTLVLIDDSIVRGATLRDSIIKIVSRLRPKKIVIVSSAPQIRYPDCYGIDMSKMKEFVAFQALIKLLEEHGKSHLLHKAYKKAKKQLQKPDDQIINVVQDLYDQFSYETISDKIAEIITPADTKPEIKVIYQTVEDLKRCCPNNDGSWYFDGNYPTPGGMRVVNRAFINYMENSDARAY